MKYNPAKNPDQYVVWYHESATDVMSPVRNSHMGRERICTCLCEDHRTAAQKLAKLLNKDNKGKK